MVDIIHRVGVRASLDQVYGALATPEGVAAWWTTETTGDRKAGGVLKVGFTSEGKQIGVFNIRVLELVPGKRVLWQVLDGAPEWVGTKIAFDLKQEDGFTIVLFKHQGWSEPGEFMSHCSTKWAIFLMSLKSLLETGRGAPSPNDVKISNWH